MGDEDQAWIDAETARIRAEREFLEERLQDLKATHALEMNGAPDVTAAEVFDAICRAGNRPLAEKWVAALTRLDELDQKLKLWESTLADDAPAGLDTLRAHRVYQDEVNDAIEEFQRVNAAVEAWFNRKE